MVIERPWGTFEVLLDTEYTKVKEIIVKPGEQLSYQFHYNRNEAWVIVKGFAEVIIDDIITNHHEGDSVWIGKEMKHRVKNTGLDDLIFIETQTGESFEEMDIVRLKDNYGRNNE